MKLLLDENLSDRILPGILDLFPGSSHVKPLNLHSVDDNFIWEFAGKKGFAIVSKDSDFHQLSLVFGHPPKFIYLRIGNAPTNRVIEVLRSGFDRIAAFEADFAASILILT